MSRRTLRLTFVSVILALTAAALFTSVALAGKPVRPSSYAPSLSVAWPNAASTNGSTNYVVSGCGYKATYGGVNIVVQTPSSTQFAGQPVDANGCVSLSNFWTQGAGHYIVSAYQRIGGKDVRVAVTSFDL
jgi:hypothetical protein